MAKWGEGDPRWIVEERPDSVNVNNWHWTEKNCLPWTEQYLKDELKKLKKEVMEKAVSVTSVTVEGESTIGNRKGKIYFIYDLHLTIKWKGDSDVASAEGKIKVDDVCQDDDPDDYQYSITCEDETSLKAPLKDFAKSNLIPLIKKVLQSLKSDIRTAHEKDVLLPTKDSNAPQKQAPTKQVSGSVSSSQSSNSSSSSSALSDTKTVTMKIELLASAQDIFDALTNPQKVQIWTRSKAEITPKAGSAFSLFDGNITGEIISLDPGKKIEKKWRLRDWPQGHFSIVTLQLSQGSSSTDVELTQTLVPSDRFESTTENWHRFFWNQLKGVFGWGILD